MSTHLIPPTLFILYLFHTQRGLIIRGITVYFLWLIPRLLNYADCLPSLYGVNLPLMELNEFELSMSMLAEWMLTVHWLPILLLLHYWNATIAHSDCFFFCVWLNYISCDSVSQSQAIINFCFWNHVKYDDKTWYWINIISILYNLLCQYCLYSVVRDGTHLYTVSHVKHSACVHDSWTCAINLLSFLSYL